MFATAALPLSVEPIIGESATSLASRLAWRNGAPRLITLCSDLGIDHRGLTNGAEAEIHRVAELAAQDPAPLLFWTPRLVEPGWFQLGQERIKFTALSRTRTWACPLCLAECPADTPLHTGHPGAWQLESIRSCARHGCAQVPMPTAPSNKDVFDFARIVERYAPAASAHVAEPHMALEHYLIARIASENPGSGWLDGLPLHVAAQTSENLGILMTLGPDARRSEITDLQWIEAGAVGYRILAEGPDALHQLLADMKRGYINDAGRYRTRNRHYEAPVGPQALLDGARDTQRECVGLRYPPLYPGGRPRHRRGRVFRPVERHRGRGLSWDQAFPAHPVDATRSNPRLPAGGKGPAALSCFGAVRLHGASRQAARERRSSGELDRSRNRCTSHENPHREGGCTDPAAQARPALPARRGRRVSGFSD